MNTQAAKQGFHATVTASRPRLTIGAALGLVAATSFLLAVMGWSL